MKEYVTQDGKKIYRLSRWIKIKHNYNVSIRNSLYNYATDENGYLPAQQNFNKDSCLTLDYFEWNGRKYAIEQFLKLGYPMFFENEEGKTSFISGYDCENWYDPILIELNDCCESVRVFTEKDI